MKQLMFTYRSTTSDIGSSSNGNVGTLIMATSYNPNNAPFTDKVVMMEYDGAMSAKTTESMRHGIECDPKKLPGDGHKYVRTAGVDIADLKDTDCGNFQYAVCGTPSGMADSAIGELWVTYSITLRKPKFVANLGSTLMRDYFVNDVDWSASGQTAWATCNSNGLALNLKYGKSNNIGCTLQAIAIAGGTATRVTFPSGRPGTYRVQMRMIAQNATGVANVTNANCSVSQGVKLLDFITYGTPGVDTFGENAVVRDPTGTAICGEFTVQVRPSNSASFVDLWWTATSTAVTVTAETESIDIIQVNPDYYNSLGRVALIDRNGVDYVL